MEKELQIRNSTADFLVFTRQNGEEGINVRIEGETVWLTQDGIAMLFDKARTTITEHIRNIYQSGELDENRVCRKFRQTASDGKNYLSEDELRNMNELVTMYLDYAARQARRHIPMTMQDWAGKLDYFLKMNDEQVLDIKGTISHEEAILHAETEFEKYRVIQDALYSSDFDLFAQTLEQSK